MTKISKGDKVEALDEEISGLVIKTEGKTVTLLTADGFSFDFREKDLIKISEEDDIRVDKVSLNLAAREKQEAKQHHPQARTKKKERNLPAMEVDLHIHELVSSTRGMQNFDMLNLQLDTAKRKLDFAIKKRIPKIVFIHGVGEGVLRAELERLFRSYDNLEFYDADFKKYGLGATEVRVFQMK
jgi:hypothetical protein